MTIMSITTIALLPSCSNIRVTVSTTSMTDPTNSAGTGVIAFTCFTIVSYALYGFSAGTNMTKGDTIPFPKSTFGVTAYIATTTISHKTSTYNPIITTIFLNLIVVDVLLTSEAEGKIYVTITPSSFTTNRVQLISSIGLCATVDSSNTSL